MSKNLVLFFKISLLLLALLFLHCFYRNVFDSYYCFKVANKGAMVKRRKFIQNKLWRDKAPARMEATGAIIHIKKLDDVQYHEQLGLKLIEEANEVAQAKTAEELKYEIADVLEVIDCIMKAHNFSKEEITACQDEKRDERGSFLDRKFVTVSEYLPGSFGEQYTLKDPTRYIEILE